MEGSDSGKGKEFTMKDDKGPNSVVLRSKQGVFVTGAYEESLQNKLKIYGSASFMLQTKNGEFIIVGSENNVLVYNLRRNEVVFEENFNHIYSMTLSPNDQLLQILEKVDTTEGKTLLYQLPTMKLTAEYRENQYSNYYNKQAYPLIRFTTDDQLYFRYNAKVMEVYDRSYEKIREIKVGPMEFFEVSKVSNKEQFLLASLYLDKKTNEGQCQLYSSNSEEPIYQKHIKKAEEIIVKFSPTSNNFIMGLQTYYDPTGKSYYGEYGLFIYNEKSNKISRIETQKGPVHDFSWHRSGEKFIVVSGFMPATSVLFSKENKKLFQFGKKNRNCICWGNLGRFVCLAGFGNLSGEMEVWDLDTLKQIGFCKSNSASGCQWSLDDRKLMTTIVTPRLRVDNCMKVYAYTGTFIMKVNFQHTELYDVQWLNNGKAMESRGVSPGRKIEVEPKKEEAKFKSFASSMGFQAVKLGEEKVDNKPKVAPGQHPDDVFKKKRRRGGKNKELNVG